MATNPQELAPGAEVDEELQTGAEGESEGGEQQADETPEEVKALARDMGWTDRDKFTGPAEAWKPADQYIRDGREIQRATADQLKALRSTVENMTRTSAAVMETEITRRVEELSGRYTKAVEDGDARESFRLANEIGALTAPKRETPQGPGPEAADFASRNSTWFQKDPLGTALAVDICNRLSAQGYDHATQLAAAEKEVRRVYPHLFAGTMNGTKPQAGVNRPGGRAPAGQGGKQKGFADMPLEAQKAANEMIERGVIKAAPDAARKLYAENYWQMEKRKA